MDWLKKPPAIRAGMTLFLTATVLFLFFAGCGGNGGSSEVESLVNKAQDAGGSIESYRMAISMSFASAGAGEVKTEEVTVEVAGDDISLTDTYFDPETAEGTIIQEAVRVGDKQWTRDLAGGGWMEEEATLDEEAAAIYTAHISEYLSNSVSAMVLGDEEMNGVMATHLNFELSPENVSSLLTDIPQSNLEGNTGGQVDIWLDATTYHPVKYKIVYRNVTLGSGYTGVDVHIDIDITGINQPLEISPPV
jgi:outer membrane lipoprotein-sorting protein